MRLLCEIRKSVYLRTLTPIEQPGDEGSKEEGYERHPILIALPLS